MYSERDAFRRPGVAGRFFVLLHVVVHVILCSSDRVAFINAAKKM